MSETRKIMESLGIVIKPTYTAIQEIEDNGFTVAEVVLANEVARLRSENAKLRAALKPFVFAWTEWNRMGTYGPSAQNRITDEDFRHAQSALSPVAESGGADPLPDCGKSVAAHESAGNGESTR